MFPRDVLALLEKLFSMEATPPSLHPLGNHGTFQPALPALPLVCVGQPQPGKHGKGFPGTWESSTARVQRGDTVLSNHRGLGACEAEV